MISSSLRLVPVTPANFDAVCAVRVHPDQEHLVSPVMKSLAEAYVHGDTAWPRAIVDGDEVVGFVMAFMDYQWAKDPQDIRSGLWRLNIAADRQGRGYGRFAVEAVTEEIRRRGGRRVYVTWKPAENSPEPFYLGLGFRRTGEFSDDEPVGVLHLDPTPNPSPDTPSPDTP
ncbi:GNAT family N-acetyltransferase [Streptomyces sp. NPDC029721]|uniref:GNAT family N-acetyltransferase n=1 Tax=Streptomyces sp. NPDC029721 TaxID=3157090 RepID=UPI0033F3C5E2